MDLPRHTQPPLPIAVFRHVPGESIGTLETILLDCGYQIEYYDCWAGVDPLPHTIQAFIFMGGPMSANDPLPYLAVELDIIRQAIGAGKPVLGICLGAQLIAKALGERVYPNPTKEIGWFPIHWTPAARADALLCHLHEPENLFQWHGDTFDLPAGAEWLATSDLCRNQAFRLGSNVYGFQFHLEVTPEIVLDWLEKDNACGDARELTEPVDPYLYASRQQELARQIFGRWAALIA